MDFKEARQAMVDCQLATNNIISEKVLDAMGSIPREAFLPDEKKQCAYIDEDIAISEGRFLLEPMVAGRMIQALEPKVTDIALDVGGGSGYSAAVLSKMVETVVALEPIESLRTHAAKLWVELDMCNIADIDGNQQDKAIAEGSYDIIFVNGAVCEIPTPLIDLLKENTGRLVCVLRKDPQSNGQAILVQKFSIDGNISILPIFDANVPYLLEFAPKEEFTF